LIADPDLAAILSSSLAPGPDPIIMLMFNQGHLPLARNALNYIERVGLLPRTLVMGIGPSVCTLLLADEKQHEHMKGKPTCYTLPDVSSFCPHCGKSIK
jgi:hypothetical protein